MSRFVATLALVVVLTLTACGARPEVRAANTVREIGHVSAELLHATCTEPYARAAELAPEAAQRELERLDALGCREAGIAHELLRVSHGTLVNALERLDSGRCAPALAAECNLVGAVEDVVLAASQLAVAIERVKERSR